MIEAPNDLKKDIIEKFIVSCYLLLFPVLLQQSCNIDKRKLVNNVSIDSKIKFMCNFL